MNPHVPTDTERPARVTAAPPHPDPNAIPVVDFSRTHLPDARQDIVAEVTRALATVGAFYAVGTLVQPSMVSAVADAFRPFFEVWSEDARAVYTARDSDGGARGYVPRFSAADDPTGPADDLRSYIWHPYDRRLGLVPLLDLSPRERELWDHENLIPDLPGGWPALRVLAALFAAVRAEVLALLEEGLGWEPGRFARWLGHGDASTLVVNHYQRSAAGSDGGTCLSPHTDLGALTINALDGHSGIDGLWYRGWQSQQWLPAPEPPAGALPVFAGRLLAGMGVAHAFEHYVQCTRRADQPNRMSVVGFGQPGITQLVNTAPTVTEPMGSYYIREIGRSRLLHQPD